MSRPRSETAAISQRFARRHLFTAGRMPTAKLYRTRKRPVPLTLSAYHVRNVHDGIINLYKPVGLTSAKAVYRVRKLIPQRKSGHAGTLDPLAEGVLLICLGKATKLVERVMDQAKVYYAEARLDMTSASFDADEPLQPVAIAAIPDEAAVRAAAAAFQGVIQQAPPALSAIKVGGRPAYRLARRGAPPELPPRPVRVDSLRIESYAWPTLKFELRCGRGFYVRSLIRDLGLALGVGGCLTRLIRRAVGPFTTIESTTFEELAGADSLARLIPLEDARALLA